MKKLLSPLIVLVLWLWVMDRDYNEANARTFDEAKQERLAKQRAFRRANEIRFEACMRLCSERCK